MLHALLVVWLAAQPEPDRRTAPFTVVEVELREVASEQPPRLVTPSPPAPRTSPPRASERPDSSPSTPASPEPRPGPRLSAPFAADAPTADAPSAQPFMAVPSSDLAVAPSLVPPEGPSGLRAPPIPADLVGEAARETLGRARVDRGLVHPYYSALGKQLIRAWDADRAVSRRGLKGYAEQFAENSKAWNGIWLEHAAAFGANGTPLTDSDPAPGRSRRPVDPSDRLDSNLARRREIQRQMGREFRSTRRATLKVVQDASGALLSVELVNPSNDAHVDHEAVADVRSAAEKLPPPPPEVVLGRDRLVSLWQFELVISITPPVPTFSFEFDEALRFIDARMPLDRRIYKRVKLLSVE